MGELVLVIMPYPGIVIVAVTFATPLVYPGLCIIVTVGDVVDPRKLTLSPVQATVAPGGT